MPSLPETEEGGGCETAAEASESSSAGIGGAVAWRRGAVRAINLAVALGFANSPTRESALALELAAFAFALALIFEMG